MGLCCQYDKSFMISLNHCVVDNHLVHVWFAVGNVVARVPMLIQMIKTKWTQKQGSWFVGKMTFASNVILQQRTKLALKHRLTYFLWCTPQGKKKILAYGNLVLMQYVSRSLCNHGHHIHYRLECWYMDTSSLETPR